MIPFVSADRWIPPIACLCSLMISWSGAEPSAAPRPSPSGAVDYFIIVTGEELLRGVYPDGHTHFLTRTLRPMGCHCVGSLSVDDKPGDLKAALSFALKQASLVIVTGGLGPTSNDITRETLADFTGIPLQEHPQVIAEMERRFNTPRDKLRENLRRQARVPTGGAYLKNAQGSSVGLVFEPTHAVVVALPGPPRELQPMVTGDLVPYLRGKFGVHPPGTLLTLRFVGVGQSQIDQILREHVPVDDDIFVSSLFDGSRVDFMFSLPGSTLADRARLKRLEEQLLKHLGDYFYADDDRTLEQMVAATVRARGGSLVLVEVASGGHLADNLSAVDGIAHLFAGAFVAPSEARLKDCLKIPESDWAAWKPGGDRLKELGRAAQHNTGSAWSVVVGELLRPTEGGPGDSSPYCWVAFGFPGDRWELQRLGVRGSGEAAQASLTTQILDRWRRALR